MKVIKLVVSNEELCRRLNLPADAFVSKVDMNNNTMDVILTTHHSELMEKPEGHEIRHLYPFAAVQG